MSNRDEKIIDKYYWDGAANTYEVVYFEFDEDKNELVLFTRGEHVDSHKTIVSLSFEDSDVRMETFTDEEINEYLLDFFEEYRHEEVHING